ncbi:hypothetical protein ABMA27_011357 [Loxostege sticticalis]|uniref:MADF domain-containing protein n=1 Tax=Loxostege sticticalis TaxID=481309 RepID=A0ABR3H295_LOXSC
MSEEHEYKILRELIYLYKNHPCLWDAKSLDYRCTSKKNLAWRILHAKYRELEPEADLSHLKRKIDNMKSCYQRELRKVNKSLLECTSKDDIHEPTLWYFKLFSFLDTKKEMKIDPENYDEFLSKKKQYFQEEQQGSDEQQKDEVYMIIVDDEYEPAKKISRTKSKTPEHLENYEKDWEISRYTQKLKESIQNTPKGDKESAKAHQINPFAVYIGKQLEEMSPYQRKVAEKVISEVIFLGKTDGLNFHSRVESKPRPANTPNLSPPGKSTPKAKKKTTPRRKITKNVTPVKYFPEHKVPQKTRFIDVNGEPSLLIPRPSPDPLPADNSDSFSESDGSV